VSSAGEERSTRGATHSFRLSPRACDYVDNLADGRSKNKKGKSVWVSDAIVWFFSSPLYGFEYDENGDRTGKLVRQGAGSPVPVYLYDRVEALEAELELLREPKKVKNEPQVPAWWRRFFFWPRD